VRLTALKVLRYDPETGESVVASAWGPAADWYRNIRARPALALRTARDCYVPEQRLLPQAEAFAVFDDWARRQRWFARLMLSQIGVSWEIPEAERRALVARFPFVGFRPRRDRDEEIRNGGRRTESRHVREAEPVRWRRLYRVGGAAAVATVVVALLDIALSFLPGEQDLQPGRLTATDWFARLRRGRFLALRDLGLWNVVNTTLGIPLYLALYGAHRRMSRGPAALAAALSVAGAAVYTANNRALPLLALSDRYAAATDAERAELAAAGQAMLARGEDFTPGSFPGFFLAELAGLAMGVTMLRGRVFGRATACSGLAGTGLLTAFTVVATFVPAAYGRAMVLATGGGLLSLAWHLLTARRLFQLASSVPAAAGSGPRTGAAPRRR
jgi:hypothetical protein